MDTIRRFFADQAIEAGRIVLLFAVNFAALLYLNPTLAWFSIIVVPVVMVISLFFFKSGREGLRGLSDPGGQAEHDACRRT